MDALEAAGDELEAAGSARLIVQGAEVLIPLTGVLDPEAECARLSRRLEGLAADAEKSEAKLSNEAFVSRAPARVVEAERAKLSALQGEASALRAQLGELGCD